VIDFSCTTSQFRERISPSHERLSLDIKMQSAKSSQVKIKNEIMKKNFILPTLAAMIMLAFIACQKDTTDTMVANPDKPQQVTIAKATIESVVKDAISKTVTSSVIIPFSQTLFVKNIYGGEDVQYTGQLHLVTKFAPPDPVTPPDPVIPNLRLLTNTVSLKGIGQQSGLVYQLTGMAESFQNVLAGSSFSFTHSYMFIPPNRVIPTNPVIPPNPVLFKYTIQLNSAGEVINADVVASINSDIE
jgi:hypothetical protein